MVTMKTRAVAVFMACNFRNNSIVIMIMGMNSFKGIIQLAFSHPRDLGLLEG